MSDSTPAPTTATIHRLSTLETADLPEEPNTADPRASVRSRLRIVMIMVGLCMHKQAAVFLAALNQTVVATAIPTISNDLPSSGNVWISAAYLLANAVAAPIWSKFSDIWGRKLILLTAIVLYFVFSILCAVSQSMQMLIISRSFQGAAGGGLVQIVYITISDMFSMRARTFYLGLLQVMWAFAGGLGPVMGGILAEYASWRWIFWINLPISSIAFLILWTFLDVHNPKTGFLPGVQAVDWFGLISMLVFMVTLLLGLNLAGNLYSWSSPLVISLLVSGVMMAGVFLLWERKARFPLVPLDIFGTMSNIGTLIIGFSHDWVVFSIEFYLPLYFQATKSASPFQSGYLIIPVTLTQAVVAMAAGVIVRKTGRYLELIWIRVAILTLGNGLYINLKVSSPLGHIIAFQIIAATGAGLLFQPPLIALQALVPPQKTAAATATLGLIRNLSTSIAIVVGGVVFSSGMNARSSTLLNKGLSKRLVDAFSGSHAAENVMLIDKISDSELQAAVKDSFAGSLHGVWILCTCMSFCAVVASALLSRQVLSTAHEEVRTGIDNM